LAWTVQRCWTRLHDGHDKDVVRTQAAACVQRMGLTIAMISAGIARTIV
jgi:hypothetical protein